MAVRPGFLIRRLFCREVTIRIGPVMAHDLIPKRPLEGDVDQLAGRVNQSDELALVVVTLRRIIGNERTVVTEDQILEMTSLRRHDIRPV